MQALAQARQAQATQADDWKHLKNVAKRMARKDRIAWTHEQLSSDPSATHSNIWNIVRRQKKGFVGVRRHLEENGIPQPWSQTHMVFRNHLQNSQWQQPNIPPEDIQGRQSRPRI